METVESAQPMEAGRTEIAPSQHAGQTLRDTTPAFDALGPEHLALREFTATDRQRPGLAALYMKDGVVYATDGSIAMSVPAVKLAQSEIPVIEGMGNPAAMGVSILPNALDRAMRAVDPKAASPVLRHVFVSQSSVVADADEDGRRETTRYVHLSATDLEASVTVRSKQPDVEYPDVRKVLPEKAGRTQIAFKATLLKKLAAYVDKFGGGHILKIWFDPANSLAPILVEFDLVGNRKATAVIAPVRTY